MICQARNGFYNYLVCSFSGDTVKADQPAVPWILLFTCRKEERDNNYLQVIRNISKRTGSILTETPASSMNTSGEAVHQGHELT